MDGIHDMGGMHGFGPIPIEADGPVFHEDWEAKAMALRMAMGAWGKWSIDGGRHANERLSPLQYLQLSYYERWITSLADLAVEQGLVSLDEVKQGHRAPESEKQQPPLPAAVVAKILSRGRPTSRDIDAPPRFAIGNHVRTNANSPRGHTRLPRYARGRVGEIILHHGAHVFPDSMAQSMQENPQHLYTLSFAARELWGEQGRAGDTVTLDCWESYLDDV